MKIQTIAVGPLQNNCYIASDETGNGIIIDPGFSDWLIAEKLKGLKIKYIILTHGHFDHFLAAEKLKALTGAEIIISKVDAEYLKDPDKCLTSWFEVYKNFVLVPDIKITEKDILTCGSLTISFIETPGHTEGSVCIKIGDCLFSGDTLFHGDIGRTDMYGGNMASMLNSLKTKLYPIKENLKIYPGHLEPTDLDTEKETNIYFR